MKNRNAFVLLDFIIAISVMAAIGVLGIKMLLNLQSQNYLKAKHTQISLEVQNALDMIENYVLEAQRDSIVFEQNVLSWRMLEGDQKIHQVVLKNKALYLDGLMVLNGVNDFFVHRDREKFEVSLCTRGKIRLVIRN